MLKKIDFHNLPEDIRLSYIAEAFLSLLQDNQVPYSITTGDDGTWEEYDPAITLAEQNYINEE